jgi:hypothetical protein
MKIKKGATRIVLLCNNVAIKIARPRIFGYIFRMLFLPFASKRNKENYYKTYGSPLKSWSKYILYGFQANYTEHTYSTKYKDIDPDIVPIHSVYLRGWIIVQKMGLEVSPILFKKRNPFKRIRRRISNESKGIHQYVFWNNRVCLADYGATETVQDLIKTMHLRISLSG